MKILGRIKAAFRAAAGGGQRAALPQRRDCDHISFEHEGNEWTASIGRYDDGRFGEIFLQSNKTGSKVEAMAQDAAVATSIAVQYGAPVEVIAKALTRDSRGAPHGPLGRALDLIIGEQERKPDPVLERSQ